MPPLEEGSGNLGQSALGRGRPAGGEGTSCHSSPWVAFPRGPPADATHAAAEHPAGGPGRGRKGLQGGLLALSASWGGGSHHPEGHRTSPRPSAEQVLGAAPRTPAGDTVQARHCPVDHSGAGTGLGSDDRSGKLPGGRWLPSRGAGLHSAEGIEQRRGRQGRREAGRREGRSL